MLEDIIMLALQSQRSAHSTVVLDDSLIAVDTTSTDQHKLYYLVHHRSKPLGKLWWWRNGLNLEVRTGHTHEWYEKKRVSRY